MITEICLKCRNLYQTIKMLSRNFEKVLHVLQIVFEAGGSFVTCNYYIRDGYIEKRRRILKAAHDEREVVKKMMNVGGTTPRLRDVLKGMQLPRHDFWQ